VLDAHKGSSPNLFISCFHGHKVVNPWHYFPAYFDWKLLRHDKLLTDQPGGCHDNGSAANGGHLAAMPFPV